MKRPLIILLLSASPLFAQTSSRLPLSGVAGITSSGGGGIAVVRHQSVACAAALTCSLAYSVNNASGSFLAYICMANESSGQTAATDNNTNTISNATSVIVGGSSLRMDIVSSSHSGANTATCNSTSAVRQHIHIWEVSGLSTGTLDKSNTGSQSCTTAANNCSISTSTATTTANEIVFGVFYDQPNDDSITAGTGYSPSEFVDGGAGNESSLTEVKIVSSTGTQTATATIGAANTITQTIATFK